MRFRIMVGLVCLACLVAAARAVAGGATGEGRLTNATPVSAKYTLKGPAGSLTIYNAIGTNVMYALANISTNDFNTRYAEGSTIPIFPGIWHTFDSKGDKRGIQSVVFRTKADTNTTTIGAF